MKYIASCSFGKDSLAMVLKLIENDQPLDEVVFYDTSAEFNAIYNLRDNVKQLLDRKGIKYTELKPEMPFFYKMFEKPVCKRGTKEIHKCGYSWCGGTCRWGTTDKLQYLDKYIGKNIDYIGIAIDEVLRLEKKRKENKRVPLATYWQMTEKDCLKYCYEQNYNWLEKTDSIYNVPKYIDLYEVLDRVSCWCCRNKNLKELKAIYYYFTNSYWQKLKEIQAKLPDMPMKQSGSVFELEERFKKEIEAEKSKVTLFNYSNEVLNEI